MKREEFEQLKDSSIGHSLIKAGRIYSEFSFDQLKEYFNEDKLKLSHLQLFPFIPFEGITIVQLAKKVNISKQAVSVMVNDLLEIGLLEKRENPEDGRSFLITFNENAPNGLYEGMKLLSGLDSQLIELLGKNNSKVFHQCLLKIIKEYSG